MTLELKKKKSISFHPIPLNYTFREGERQVKIKSQIIFSYGFVFTGLYFLSLYKNPLIPGTYP